MRLPRVWRGTAVAWAVLLTLPACGAERAAPVVELSVFNAAALGPPFRDALSAFALANPGTVPAQQNAPSLEVVRMMTELSRTPDVLAVADRALFDSLVVPGHADWYALFGTNALVLAYGPRARFREEITAENWWKVLQRPDVEVGRSDLRVDPSGYRADMAMQLAERYYGQPGLAERLRAGIPARNVRRAEADLSLHLELGELDYGWTYESLARAHKLAYLKLPTAVDLSDPAQADWYATAAVSLPQLRGRPPLVIRGAPIVFALTIPRGAEHPLLAERFVAFLLWGEGRSILERSGFTPLSVPQFAGAPPAGVSAPR